MTLPPPLELFRKSVLEGECVPYSSSLRSHLKAHSGERSNKCNQCDFASFQAIKTIKTVEQNCDPLIHLSYVDDLKILAKELNSEIKRAFDCSGGIR